MRRVAIIVLIAACRKDSVKEQPVDAGPHLPDPSANVSVKEGGKEVTLHYAISKDEPSGQGTTVYLSERPLGCDEEPGPRTLSFVRWSAPPSGYRSTIVDAFWTEDPTVAAAMLRARMDFDTITSVEGGFVIRGPFQPKPCPSRFGSLETLPEPGVTTPLEVTRLEAKAGVRATAKAKGWIDAVSSRLSAISIDLGSYERLDIHLHGAQSRADRDLMMTPQPIAVRLIESQLHAQAIVHDGRGWIRFSELDFKPKTRFRAEVGAVIRGRARATGMIEGELDLSP